MDEMREKDVREDRSGGAGQSAQETAQKSAPDAAAHAPAGAPKRRAKRWPLVVGVVAIVLVAAGAGFWVWHEQPSFCNAICHDPMDAYVEGYFNDATLMANAHEREDVSCLQCHEAKIDEQVTEALSWVRGDFATDETGHLTTQGVTADSKMCATEGCHNFDEVIATTENWGGEEGVNPHRSHQGIAIDCSNCHGGHTTSYMYCNACHDYETPDGWLNPSKGGRA